MKSTGEFGAVGHPGIDGADERSGVGLLSRFLGAVFLVLLGGLLLLDRALLHANESQGDLDTQSAALLAESFLASQGALVDHIADFASALRDRKDTAAAQLKINRLTTSAAGVSYAWAERSMMARLESQTVSSLPALEAEALRRMQPAQGTSLSVVRLSPTRRVIALVRARNDSGKGMLAVGVAVDASAMGQLLERTRLPTRLTLTVLAGMDTVTSLGSASTNRQGLSTSRRLIRLPTGGAWIVTSTHAVATRTLRWALWLLGVLGVLFLALGLLREQHRALQAVGRSRELERLYSDVKRANQAKSEFLANVSHELRTPLNAIVGFVELLREGFYGELSPRQVQPVERIAASATHLRHLVDQVLDIAKIAAGRLEVQSETIVLRAFVINVASELESLVSEKGLTFSLSVGASLPRVRTDPTHLRQILINLIGNAVKFTSAGTVSVRARLVGYVDGARDSVRLTPTGALADRAPTEGVWIALQVTDTGIGIPPADIDRIFDEFEQVNAGPRGDSINRGTGLGLAISRRLARLLNGEITVESQIGRGSTFTVWLPVNAADLTRDPVGVQKSTSIA